MLGHPESDAEPPKLLVKVNKKLNSLTFTRGTDKVVLDITDGEVDIIPLDMWLTELFKAEYDKEMLRKRLSGK